MCFEQDWEKLEVRVQILLERVRAMSPESRRKAAPREVSPTQVIGHLALVENMYIAMIEKTDRAKYSQLPPGFGFLGKRIVAKLRSGGKIPGPSSLFPDINAPLEPIVREWEATRKVLFEKLSSVKDSEVCCRHPLFGLIGRVQILEVFSAHLEYHEQRFPRG